MALSYYKLNLPENAEAVIDRAVADGAEPALLTPRFEGGLDPDYHKALAYAMLQFSDLENALAQIKAALASAPLDPVANYYLGLIYYEAGDQAASREQYLALSRIDVPLADRLYQMILFPVH
jgi:tetratricopeptide (TPR) repeat protein